MRKASPYIAIGTLLSVLIFASIGRSSPEQIVRYVNGTCSENGDGSSNDCAKGEGQPGAHSDACYCVEAERAIGVNLTSRDVNIKCSLTNGASPDSCSNFFGSLNLDTVREYPGGGGSNETFIKDSTHGITLEGDPLDPYQIDSDAVNLGDHASLQYVRVHSTDTGVVNVVSIDAGSFLEGVQIICDSTNAASYGLLVGNLQTDTAPFANNIISGCGNGVQLAGFGTNLFGGIAYTRWAFYNLTIEGAAGTGFRINQCYGSSSDCDPDNPAKSILFLGNLLIQGSGTADISWDSSCDSLAEACFISLGANATSDGSSPDGASYQNQTASFQGPGAPNYNYRLQAEDAVCLRRGIDLTENSFYSVTHDFEGQPRASSYSDCGGDGVPPTEIPTHRLNADFYSKTRLRPHP